MRDPVVALFAMLFFASELTVAAVKRSRFARGATRADRGSGPVLWVVISLAIVAAVSVSQSSFGRLALSPFALRAGSLILIVGGLAFRWWAVIALGKFFTIDVAVHEDHALIDTGPFRLVRHPSYTGLLAAFLGVGWGFGNVVSLVVLMVPIVLALSYRIHVEEAALRRAFGARYDEYCERRKRVIPGIL